MATGDTGSPALTLNSRGTTLMQAGLAIRQPGPLADRAFMPSLASNLCLSMTKRSCRPWEIKSTPSWALTVNTSFPAFDRHEFHRDGDVETRRGCRLMADVDMRAEGLLAWPVQVGIDGLDAGPFEQTDHEGPWQRPPAWPQTRPTPDIVRRTVFDGGTVNRCS